MWLKWRGICCADLMGQQLSWTCSGVEHGHVTMLCQSLALFISSTWLNCRGTLAPKRFLSAPQLPLQCICTFHLALFASPGPVDSIVPEMPKAEKLINSVNLIASYKNRVRLVQKFWPIMCLKLTWVFRVPSGNMATQILGSSVCHLGCQRFLLPTLLNKNTSSKLKNRSLNTSSQTLQSGQSMHIVSLVLIKIKTKNNINALCRHALACPLFTPHIWRWPNWKSLINRDWKHNKWQSQTTYVSKPWNYILADPPSGLHVQPGAPSLQLVQLHLGPNPFFGSAIRWRKGAGHVWLP